MTDKEYRKGFSVVSEGQVEAVLTEIKREKRGAKNLLRVFAATLEEKVLHGNSRVDLYRIINHRADKKGIKKLSEGEIKRALGRLESLSFKESRTRSVSRIFLKLMAGGELMTSEGLIFFYYSIRRIRPVRELERLKKGEAYGRFRYKELSEISGIAPGKISAALNSLKGRGLLATIPVHKQNENAYGQLFVDGALISLVRTFREAVGKVIKRERPLIKKGTTPHHKTERLRKEYLKTPILREKDFIKSKKETKNQLFDRLRARIEAEKALIMPQTA